MEGYVIAVVGATGAVGSTMLKVLAQSSIPVRQVRALATARSAGTEFFFGDQKVVVEDIAQASFAGVDVALFAGGEIASSDYAPKAVAAGALVVDNSSHFRMDPQVPLVVPEVNPQHLLNHKRLVANPNCSTIQMVLALAPLHAAAGLKKVSVATYQSVSGTGKPAIDELTQQQAAVANGTKIPAPQAYTRQICNNLIPQIASFDEDGYSGEERKMIMETRRILDLPNLPVCATCVRVPVFYAHSEVVQAEFERPLSVAQARRLLADFPGIKVIDDPQNEKYPTPIDAEGQDLVFVGRVRRDETVENGLVMWVVGDNLRKGAATNAVQIAELLLKQQSA